MSLKALYSGSPFSFSRWGKPEWSVLLQHEMPCESEDEYSNDLRRELWDILYARPRYLIGLSQDCLDWQGTAIMQALEHRSLHDLTWANGDFLRKFQRIKHREFDRLISYLRHVELILVGPDQLKKTRTLLDYAFFVDVPPQHAYLAVDQIEADILEAAYRVHRPTVISLSAGVTAPVLVDRLYRRLGDKHTIIDFGDFWDLTIFQK